jgi:hypothetical protein
MVQFDVVQVLRADVGPVLFRDLIGEATEGEALGLASLFDNVSQSWCHHLNPLYSFIRR